MCLFPRGTERVKKGEALGRPRDKVNELSDRRSHNGMGWRPYFTRYPCHERRKLITLPARCYTHEFCLGKMVLLLAACSIRLLNYANAGRVRVKNEYVLV